jgi:uncharacterized protein DUF3383
MSLQDLVNVSISSSTVSPTRPGFGTPLLMCYHTVYSDLVRFYSSLTGVAGDFSSTTSIPYRMAEVAFAQNPAPVKIAIGKRASAMTQKMQMTLSDSSGTATYTLTIVGSDGVSHTMNFASTGTPATDATSLYNAINALSNAGTATNPSSGVVLVTQSSGKLNDYQNWNPTGTTSPILSLSETTTDPGIATDLANAIAFAPPGSVYGVALDNNSKAEITAAAAYVEANGPLLFLFNTSDTIAISSTSSSSSVFVAQKTLAHARSGGLYAGSQVLCWSGLAWLSKTLPQTPGSLTFMYKTLTSVPADTLSETAQTNLNAVYGNYYIPIAGINITVNGWDAAGEFLDIVWGTDALTSQIQINVFALLASSPKVPYTDLGVDMIKSVVQAALALFATPQYNFIASNPAPTVSAPTVASIATATVASRVFPNISFFGTLAGAIHSLTIQGVLVP